MGMRELLEAKQPKAIVEERGYYLEPSEVDELRELWKEKQYKPRIEGLLTACNLHATLRALKADEMGGGALSEEVGPLLEMNNLKMLLRMFQTVADEAIMGNEEATKWLRCMYVLGSAKLPMAEAAQRKNFEATWQDFLAAEYDDGYRKLLRNYFDE